jgi:hypothetical protein
MCADGLTPTRFVGGIVYPTIFHKIHVTTEDWRLVLSDSLQSLARGTLRFCTLGFCFCFTYLYKPLHLHHALRALQDWRERDARLIFRPPSSMPPPYSGASHPLRSRNRTGMLNTVIPCTLICGVLILAWIAVHSTSALLAFVLQVLCGSLFVSLVSQSTLVALSHSPLQPLVVHIRSTTKTRLC